MRKPALSPLFVLFDSQKLSYRLWEIAAGNVHWRRGGMLASCARKGRANKGRTPTTRQNCGRRSFHVGGGILWPREVAKTRCREREMRNSQTVPCPVSRLHAERIEVCGRIIFGPSRPQPTAIRINTRGRGQKATHFIPSWSCVKVRPNFPLNLLVVPIFIPELWRVLLDTDKSDYLFRCFLSKSNYGRREHGEGNELWNIDFDRLVVIPRQSQSKLTIT